jgi:hypothetical protein
MGTEIHSMMRKAFHVTALPLNSLNVSMNLTKVWKIVVASFRAA